MECNVSNLIKLSLSSQLSIVHELYYSTIWYHETEYRLVNYITSWLFINSLSLVNWLITRLDVTIRSTTIDWILLMMVDVSSQSNDPIIINNYFRSKYYFHINCCLKTLKCVYYQHHLHSKLSSDLYTHSTCLTLNLLLYNQTVYLFHSFEI